MELQICSGKGVDLKTDKDIIYIYDGTGCFEVNLKTMDAFLLPDKKEVYKITNKELENCEIFNTIEEIIDKYPEYFI